MDKLAKGAEHFGITLGAEQASAFALLLEELKAWNKRTNLTAIRDDEGIILKHFLDSISVIQVLPTHQGLTLMKLIDIGSGAGFPGLPIAIVRPDINVTLLEASQKKSAWLEHAVSALKLQNVKVVCGRAEDISQTPEHREQYDVATARAVAELRTLVEYALPFVRIGGTFIAQKNADSSETQNATQAISILGGEIQKEITIDLNSLANRKLIVIEKIKPTPEEYPRRAGTPSKKPLL